MGHRFGPAYDAGRRAATQSCARQEPRPLSGEAGMTTTDPLVPIAGGAGVPSRRGPAASGVVTIPEIPGVLSAAEVSLTAATIAEVQCADGMIPWFGGGQ